MMRKIPILTITLILLIIVAFDLQSVGVEYGVDWKIFRHAALNMLNGQNPYYQNSYWNPPWVAGALIPLALLPFAISAPLMFVINIAAFAVVFYKLHILPLLTIPLFAVVMQGCIFGNIEGLVALGFLMPAPIGLFFVMAKPQIGIGIALYWAIDAWRRGGVWLTVKTFAPLVLTYAVSFALYGNFMQTSMKITQTWNASIFPWGIPLGLAVLAWALWKHKPAATLVVGVLMSPYVNSFMSWSFGWIGLATLYRKES